MLIVLNLITLVKPSVIEINFISVKISQSSLFLSFIQEQTAELERQRVAIDEYNKQYYELKKDKDTYQSNRKLVIVLSLLP